MTREFQPRLIGAKSGGDAPRPPKEAKDSLASNAVARIIDLLCEGEIKGLVNGAQSIYLDETPLENPNGTFNFRDVVWDTRLGTQIQTPFEGFPYVESEQFVSAKVTQETPITRRLDTPQADRLRISVGFNGLFDVNKVTGDITGASVEYEIFVQYNNGGYHSALKRTVRGKTRSFWVDQVIIPLNGPDPIDVQIRRLTDDSETARIVDEMFWVSMTALTDAKFSYPHSAMVSLKIKADQFNAIPSRAYLVDMLKVKVPVNYDSVTRTYTGDWNGTFKTSPEFTDNPAWCLYNLLTSSRYGLGEFLPAERVDKWMLYQIARYCDAVNDQGVFVGVPSGNKDSQGNDIMEPRFTLNVLMQRQAEAYQVIGELISVFRGMSYWIGGGLGFSQDKPKDPEMLFTPANVKDGLFRYSGASRSARHTGVMVRWSDPTDFYRPAFEFVEDPIAISKFGLRILNVVAVGTASRGQAQRVGKWILQTEQDEDEIVEFETGLQATLLRPGAVIKIVDPGRGGQRFGGRLLSGSSTSPSEVLLDRNVKLESGVSYTISIQRPDKVAVYLLPKNSTSLVLPEALLNGDWTLAKVWVDADGDHKVDTFLEARAYDVATRTLSFNNTLPDTTVVDWEVRFPVGVVERSVTNSPGETNLIVMSSSLPQPPESLSIWVIASQAATSRLYQVITIEERSAIEYSLIALRHNPDKFDAVEQGVKIEDPPAVMLPPNTFFVLPPTDLAFDVAPRRYADGTAELVLEISWLPSRDPNNENRQDPNVVAYELLYRFNVGPWISVPPVNAPIWELPGAKPGVYDVQIAAISGFNRKSSYLAGTFTVENVNPIELVRVTGLELDGQGVNSEFTGRDARFVWRATSPFPQDFGSEEEAETGLQLLVQNYRVQMFDPETETLLRTEYVPVERYEYTYEKNQQDAQEKGLGSPLRQFRIEVAAHGFTGELGPINKLVVENPPPAAVSSITVTGGLKVLWVEWVLSTDSPDADLSGVDVYVSSEPGFTPGEDTLKFVGLTSPAMIRVEEAGTYYVRVAPKDLFTDDPASLNPSPAVRVEVWQRIEDVDIAPGAVQTEHIASLAVGTAQIGLGVIDRARIADLAVNAAKIDDGAVTTAKIGNLSVDSAKIKDLAVDSFKLQNLAVTTDKLGISSVTIGDSAFNDDEINMAQQSSGNWTTLLSVSIEVPAMPAPEVARVLLWAQARSRPGGTVANFRIRRIGGAGTITLYQKTSVAEFRLAFSEQPTPALYTYQMQGQAVGGPWRADDRSMIVLAQKK